jgi:uncharacterized protein YfbU (UPF0304 family)
MSIYLDCYGHLFSNSSIEELYNFAVVKMKFKSEWNHYSRYFPHFDCTTQNAKNRAIKYGAIYLEDTKDIIAKFDECEKIFKDDLPMIRGKGLANQNIWRVDFKTYFRR